MLPQPYLNFILALLVTAASAVVPTPLKKASPDPMKWKENVEQTTICALNQYRTQKGASAVGIDPFLSQKALKAVEAHGNEIADIAASAATEAESPAYSLVSEMITFESIKPLSVQEIFEELKKDIEGREGKANAMLDKEFTQVGFGVQRRHKVIRAALIFGASGATPQNVPPCTPP